MPIEPPPSPWRFPDPDVADEHGVVGVGADLEPGTLLQAYRSGIFPMPLGARGPMGWWSPDPRGILPLDGLVVSRSLRRSCGRYEVRFDSVVRGGDRRVQRPRPSRRLDHRVDPRRLRPPARARLGPQRRGVGRRRARGGAVRRRDRRSVRGRVDVPPAVAMRRRSPWSRSSTSWRADVAGACWTCSGRRTTSHRSGWCPCRVVGTWSSSRPRSGSRRPRGGRELRSRTGGRRGRWTPVRSCPCGRCPRRPATPGRSRGRRPRRAARSSAGSRPTASRSTR